MYSSGNRRPRRGIIRLHSIERAADAAGSVLENVGIDHRRRYVAVAEKLLHRADVVASFE